MYLPKIALCAFALLGASQTLYAALLNKCKNLNTDFTDGLGSYWSEESGSKSGWEITDEGLVMTLSAPKQIVRMTNSSDNDNPYNKYTAVDSPNFVAKNLLHYGRVTYTLKAAGTKGVVTAAVLYAPDGDEIDFEMLGAQTDRAQTNYFYSSDILYGVNGGDTSLDIDTASDFHNYTIDWTPERIKFSVDDEVIRTVKNKDDCDSDGDCTYPTHAAEIQFGMWDASNPSSTAEWAGGPVNVSFISMREEKA
ncbi:MAG: concanavalin A-like lectin/glucanase domain-containing protein [Benjaminiella poitrasii]|nr:MAG: concanavalin A-like lectin/glucanase domain-containing protein [Benjaminiella poitrasii]